MPSGTGGSRRLTILWVAAAFALVGVIGLLFVPGAWIFWVVLLVFAVTAIPQAWVRRRSGGPGESRRR